ncbi:sialic acid synthase-like [Portunus trituberculatus]|uniref:sialic acid synthase-like n=1 Tax=Portunus trituberculatus TaxID=210409 RepID=UPI001E1D1EDD|nr:sialic acid synthase-like [Portunus trituberculatus]
MEPLELVPGRYIGEGQPCFVIAEIGQNHQGDIDIAKTLIRRAKECGADCVKLQMSSLSHKFNREALSRPYDSEHSWGETYGDHKKHLEFSVAQFQELQEYANEIDMPLTASAMDIPSIHTLCALNVPFIKVGSGDVHNMPLLRTASTSNRPVVVSTGMSDIGWVSQVYEALTNPPVPLVILQCTSAYPTPPDQVHLRVIDTYAQMFPHAHIGYSGHELGIHITIAAVARGARVVERHLTLNKTWKGSDHACSLEPHDLRELVTAIRCVEAALGSPLKAFQPSEDPCHSKLGKTLVAARPIKAGQKLQEDDLVAKVAEPRGIAAYRLESLVGGYLNRDVELDESVMEADVL